MSTRIYILFLLFLSSCCSYRIPTAAIQEALPEKNLCQEEALNHWLYDVIPRHRCQIKWYDVGHWCTWMAFGNDDDGIFGEEPTANYKPGMPISFKKHVSWTLRNPFHNFCFYVIGSAEHENSEFAILKLTRERFDCFQYSPYASNNYPSKNSCLFLGFHGGKPFLSLRWVHSKTRRTDFYIGWRWRGNFGFTFHPFKKTEK